jgi:Tfp pilus assembly protein PilO
MQTDDNKASLRDLLERLHDPFRLRVLVTGVMLLVGYAGIYMLLSGRIEETTRKLSNERKRQQLANDIESLREQVDKFQDRLPENTDTNQWVKYVLDGIRRFPLKLSNMDSHSPQRVGPYEAVVLDINVEGEFAELDSFLHWLETNDRFFRVDSAKIAPVRNENGKLSMQLTLLGLKG